MFFMENVTVESDSVANMSETSLCNSQTDCDDEEGTDEGQEDVLVLETDLLSLEHCLEKTLGSTLDITTDDSSYYITWTVYIAFAVPRSKFVDIAPLGF